MSYSGNPSLSADVKERILGTFEQTLDLAREGSRQEALLGCDFVLRLDPQFEPARRLQERLKAGTGPLLPDDLAGLAQTSSPPSASANDPFAALDDLGTELPDLPVVTSAPSDLRGRILSLFEARRFDDLLALAGTETAAVAGDPELQRISALAQERHEAEPYVKKFLAAAADALAAGRLDDTRKSLAKVRSLDSEHPELARLQASIDAGGERSAPAPAWSPPLPEGPAPAASLFGGTEPESDRRIKELLDEGQTAFDSGDPQAAIDSWSRIFLIDIDHQEAARRIDAARRVKAETERQVEEVFHEGVGFLESGDLEGARRSFERVLEIQPSYFAAQEYLQQLNAGIVPTPRASVTREAAEPLVSPALEAQAAADELSQEILVPPEPGQAKRGGADERRPTKVAVAKEGRAKKLFVALGGVVLLLALGGGWYLYQQKDSLFPNSDAEPEKVAPTEDPIARAEKLQQAGKESIARAILRRIQPSDPTYEKAQKLIADWDAAAKPAENATSDVAVVDETTARRAALLNAARTASGEARYLAAYRLAMQADGIAKLDGEDALLIETLRKQLAPVIKYVDLFQQHEWEMGLRDLWELHDANPGNRDVTQLIVDSYYNLGVRELQRGDAAKAADRFQEALKLMPDDAMARRAQAFAQSYRSRNKDLLYRIFVKYLPTR